MSSRTALGTSPQTPIDLDNGDEWARAQIAEAVAQLRTPFLLAAQAINS